ncbi:MAG: NAD(P)H-quinone oxidoreductase [Gemmatimonadetes bacterium]|nr:NAD(P)H-quinone oxidoreductase [Gemmatimonadota bacterium]
MRAIVITAPGGPEVLEERELALPEPGPGQVRVRVHAAGLNRADLLQRLGRYPAPPGVPAEVPGLEYAGTVDAAGPDARRWQPGDRVMGLVAGGAYAEAVLTQEREAVPVPEQLSFEEAAAIPEAFITAQDALFTRLELRPGERLLVHAVGSGVGTAAVQLARAAGATVYGTARAAWKLERAAELGLEAGIDAGAQDFAEALLRLTGGTGVHAILDLVGGHYLAGNMRALEPLGRLAVVGLVAGARAELDLGILLRKRLTVVGTTLRARPLEEKIRVARDLERHVLPLLAAGRVRPVLDRVYPMGEVREAHRRLEANENFGKIVLRW